jgi:hypothetical protein
VNDDAVAWNTKDGGASLSPKEVGSLPFGVPVNAARFRVVFEYVLDGGPFQKAVSRGVRNLPINRLPLSLNKWLVLHGWIDGYLHDRYEGSWMPNQPVQWLGVNPPIGDTNGVSSAAGSGR